MARLVKLSRLRTTSGILGCAVALALGAVVEACATSLGDSGANCANLLACCPNLPAVNVSQCNSLASSGNDSNCATELMTLGGSCGAGSGSGSGVDASIDTGAGTGTGTGIPLGTGSGSSAGLDSGTGTGTGVDAGIDSGSGTGTGTGAGTGSGTGGGGGVPTTCAEANGAIGCCGPDGKAYYCAGSGTGSTTVTAKTCASGTTCGWDTSKGYYYCVATPGTAPSGDPIACQ